jgi:TP901 family phage tail tape measure protein
VTFLIGAVNQAAPGIAAVAAGFANLTAIGMRTAAEMTAGMRAVEAGFMAVGAASALALGVATSEAMKFEKQMKMIQAVSNDMTSQQITQMSSQIKALSIKYGEAPAATAEAMQTLGRAGIKDATAQMAIFESAMKMAKIEGMDLQAALEGIVQTTSLFGSDMNNAAQFAKDAAKMTEYLVHASQISPTDVPDIMQGLTYVGGAAKEVGWSPTETMSAISYMAQKGVSGSIAGTSIRGLLTKSVGDQPKYQKAAARLGLDPDFAWIKDASGKETARPLAEIVQIVRDAAKQKGLGEREQFELWNAIGMQKTAQQMLKINPDELREFDAEMEKNFDLNKKVETAMSSASVQFDRFKAAVTVLAINIGEKLLPALAWIAGALANVASWAAQSQPVVWGLFAILAGGLVIGAAVVMRWLAVAIRWTVQEMIRMGASANTLKGVLAGNVTIGELFAKTQAQVAAATEADTIATNTNTVAHERNAIARKAGMVPPTYLGQPITGAPVGRGVTPINPLIPSTVRSGPIIPPTATPGMMSRIGTGLRGAGSAAMGLMGGPLGVALIGGLAVGYVASTIQDTKNVARHNEEAMKNANLLVESYTGKIKKLRDEKSRLITEQTKYNKSSSEYADLQRRISAKDEEIGYYEDKRSKAQEKIAKNEEEIARWTENSAVAYQNMLATMEETPVPKPGVTAPTIPVPEGTVMPQGLTDISTRPYKTQEAVWRRFVEEEINPRRKWVETSDSPMARFYRSDLGKIYNTRIEESKQKEKELWLRTMGIDPATGKPFEAGQYGATDWLTDYIKLGGQKVGTGLIAREAGIKADQYDLNTGKKKEGEGTLWWQQLFGVKPKQSLDTVKDTSGKTNSLLKGANNTMVSSWLGSLSKMNSGTALFSTNTQANMSNTTNSVLGNVNTITQGLFGLQGGINLAIGWFQMLWAAARGGVVGVASSVISTAFNGAFVTGTTQALATATASGNQGTIQKTQQQVNTPFFNVQGGTASPVKLWRGGATKEIAGAVSFPELDPDVFKKRAIETGKALGAGKGGGIQIGTIVVNANTKNDAKYISEAIRAELQKLAKAA